MTDDYETGYKKPPKHTQFKPGQSGNPDGRPKHVKNVMTDLDEELQELITVREGEIRKQVSKQRAMLKALIARAVQGDPRCAAIVLEMINRLLHSDDTEIQDERLDEEDLAILKAYEMRVQLSSAKAQPESPDGETQPNDPEDSEQA